MTAIITVGRWDFRIPQGDAFDVSIALTDDNDDILDLTGYDATMHLRVSQDEDTFVADWSSYLTIDGPAGVIVLDVPSTATQEIDTPRGSHILRLIPPTGAEDKFRLVQGAWFLDQGPTGETP